MNNDSIRTDNNPRNSNGVKPRILIFSIAYEPLLGGAELAVRHITDRLPQYDFDLITARFSKQHAAEERIGNVNVYRVGFAPSASWRIGRYLYPMFAYRLASRLHRQKPYQIVWSIMAAYAGAAALMFLRRFPAVNYLLTLQEGDPIIHIHRRVRGMRKMWQRIFGRADYIQAISQYLAEWAKEEGAECPIEVVPNGVDLQRFKIKDSRLKSNVQFVIITTSRLVPKNGVDILIRAAAILKTLIPNSRFIIQILGTGKDEGKLKSLASEIDVSERVEFLGNVEPDKVPQYLARADIFVRPSRSEGLGTAFLEAMAAGLPVIGTRVGGIPDFLTSANGLFVNVDDPQDLAENIKLLIANEALRQELGENGRKLVMARYSWDHIARQMEIIFEKLFSTSPGPPAGGPPSPGLGRGWGRGRTDAQI